MKSPLLLLMAFIVSTHAQQGFDYQKFQETFNLNSPQQTNQDRFADTFYNGNNGHQQQTVQRSFDYDEFMKSMFNGKQKTAGFDSEKFAQTFGMDVKAGHKKKQNSHGNNHQQVEIQVNTESKAKKEFDHKAFSKQFKLPEQHHNRKEFDYDTFSKVFSQNKESVDHNRIVNEVSHKKQIVNKGKNDFDYEGFSKTFKLAEASHLPSSKNSIQTSTNRHKEKIFDIQGFSAVYLPKAQVSSQAGGSVSITSEKSQLTRQNL